MKSLYTFTFLITFILFGVFNMQSQSSDSLSSAYFSMDECAANFGHLEHLDYSEFVAEIDNSGDCADIEIVGDILRRDNPEDNMHSCSYGVNGEPAMCISTHHDCSFRRGDHALKVDVKITPGSDGVGIFSGLMFYEAAPPEYNWINGGSGPNDYAQYFAVIVLLDDEIIFRSTGNPTQPEWNLRTFDFTNRPEFTVTEPTVFNVEFYGYCPVNNGADVSAWDIDELTILSDCCSLANGGELSGGPFEFCVGDGEPDVPTGVTVSGDVGSKSQYVITDEEGMILALPPSLDSVDFDGGSAGICLIYHLSYYGTIGGLEVGNNLETDLVSDCFGLSNAITVVRNQKPEGGALVGGPFEFCVGDGVPDIVTGIMLSGNTGSSSQYIITDTAYHILALPPSLDSVDFDGGDAGICFIFHLSYDSLPAGLEVGNNVMEDLDGCFGLSNPIQVNRNQQPTAAELTGGPFEFCLGDGIADRPTGISAVGNTGSKSQWIITDDENNILALPNNIDSVNFDDGGGGICFIWHLSYEGSVSGLQQGNNIMEDLDGCMAISNGIMVVRNKPEGGQLEGGPYEFCNDSIPNFIEDLVLLGNAGPNRQYVITDTNGVILNLPSAIDSVDFNDTIPGVCLIWHMSYFDPLEGAEIGNNAMTDLDGCYNLSNPVMVTKLDQPCQDSIRGQGPVFEVRAYPNPVRETVSLFVANGGDDELVVEIYDIYGRLCKSDRCDPKEGEPLDVSMLPEGQYFIKVRGEMGTTTETIVLMR